ncbi:glycoside hydrolase family 13 protein [Mycena vitilis]|nr:glycoside hydrolase family 13 protein [Mycena vitilis]
MLAALKALLSGFLAPSPALSRMRLGPEGNPDNPLMLQFFTWDTLHNEMSWWKHLECEIPKLAKMGFTQIWLPPPNKGEHQQGRGYDAYDLWDLGEFNQKGTVKTRWGTRDELLKACQAATAHGIDIIVDAVLNHKLGADRSETFPAVPVNPQNRLEDAGPVRDIEGWTAFDFKGRGDQYSSFRWNHEHFTGLDWDHKTRSKAIYRIATKGRKGWSQYVANELGNYDYLLGVDIDHRNPGVQFLFRRPAHSSFYVYRDVQKDLSDWGVWIIEVTFDFPGPTRFPTFCLDYGGSRLQTRRYQAHRPQIYSPLFETRSEPSREVSHVLAEYWSGNLNVILPYIKAFQGETAFFDVPLHMNFHHASKDRSQYDLRKILNHTIAKEKPKDAVTFVIGQSLESWVDKNFKIQAYSLILLRQDGHPCVFYGDLYPNEECYDADTSQNLTLLINARKRFAYGLCRDYFQDPNCIGFVRMGDLVHPGCAVMLSNTEPEATNAVFIHTIRMFVGREHAGAVFRSYMSQDGRVDIDADGWGVFSCSPNAVEVWVRS